MIDRTGETHGKLTVVEDGGGAQLKCQCECGYIDLYPRALCKPSYSGPTMCKECRAHPCEICGALVYKTNKATCSDTCRRARASAMECERYNRIKGSAEWKEKRAAYIESIRVRLQADPEFRAHYYTTRRQHLATYRRNILSQPKQYAEYLQKKRQQTRAWAATEKISRRRAAYYAFWYHLMSDAEYQRIFVEPRNAKRKAKKNATRRNDNTRNSIL
ncbi:hypothetical protein [Chromobacterium violaceum]|uniref:hypothetical protein n=1 Tax=Chromobacterium violaceum TaxID=536 RepID=UPI0015F78DBF|nr:hypothetical protein [Chromobacterium violaceum]MBA8734249.1 hypothetical protein [Chromobacterium violaceum]